MAERKAGKNIIEKCFPTTHPSYLPGKRKEKKGVTGRRENGVGDRGDSPRRKQTVGNGEKGETG